MAVLCPAPVRVPLPKTILIVDAELDSLEHVRGALVGENYRVLATASTREAMRLVKREQIDIVLSEIDISGASGLDLVVAIRRAHPEVIRIVMNARPSVDATLRAINEASVHHFLTKPCDPAVLRAIVQDVLSRPADGGARAWPPEFADLSPRLRDTLEVVMTGASEKQIADRLGISHHTAHQYVQALFRSFNVTSRAQLMARVLRK
jgi:DNA-binding NarL/FixJ family response regulator